MPLGSLALAARMGLLPAPQNPLIWLNMFGLGSANRSVVLGFWGGHGLQGSCGIPSEKRHANSYVPSGFQGVCALQAKNPQMATFKAFFLRPRPTSPTTQ